MKHVVASQNDRLDTIVYTYYGTLEPLNMVMLANAHLMSKTLLDAGDKVYLPTYTATKESESDGVSLWT